MTKKAQTGKYDKSVSGNFVTLFDEEFYVIRNYDRLAPFLISVVSGSDHWMFLSTTGGITAGRKNADNALFPYYTEDKVADNAENTGARTIIRVHHDECTSTWEPFSIRGEGAYSVERNLYKNTPGTKVYFEEINHDLQLTFRYGWTSSHKYGIVRHSQIVNEGEPARLLSILDGIQNVLPYGVLSATQNEFSCLIDGYKKQERDTHSPLGIYRMSSLLTDRAEPSEALLCTTVWSTEADAGATLLSSEQLKHFREGGEVTDETDIRGKRGAYLIRTDKRVTGAAEWYIAAEVNQNHADLVSLQTRLNDIDSLRDDLRHTIERGTQQLREIVGGADGLQVSRSRMMSAHHFANVLFNVMRGGTYANGGHIERDDFQRFCSERNKDVSLRYRNMLRELPETVTPNELKEWARDTQDPDLIRVAYEYLPLFFSRRHGDPSRPWNRFSIDIYDDRGGKRLNYEGNWRDIFQNWEALSLSYPAYLSNIVVKFLNATTADGYNPYRLTRFGIDWEAPDPQNPWVNIGYWNDHQIVYLLRLLEWLKRFYPDDLKQLLTEHIFTHADVPYRIKPYQRILENNRDTIEFDFEKHTHIMQRSDELGSDGRLMQLPAGELVHTSMVEKLLILLGAKMVSFVPGGGIWMNTQRPEWNDANNALAGPGLSIVTLGHLRGYIRFLIDLLNDSPDASYSLSVELAGLIDSLSTILTEYEPKADVSPQLRRRVMDSLGMAGQRYRESVYRGVSGDKTDVPADRIHTLLAVALDHVDATLADSRRDDGLYHSYNLLVQQDDGGIAIRHLYEMLEGQVSVLSSGGLSPKQGRDLLDSLYRSSMYREDQDSFMLYPDRTLQRFVEKNTFDADVVAGSSLIARMLENEDYRIVYADEHGRYHFHGDMKNAEVLKEKLDELETEEEYAPLVTPDRGVLLDLYENVFDHNAFTGRSGTFFAYEGLGSIYWHQVAKLLLAAQEFSFDMSDNESRELHDALHAMYYRIRKGVGGCFKSPTTYGAFPMDPYSHTPKGKGAQQPGMTGQVKEEVLARLGELGLIVSDGHIEIRPYLLRRTEFLEQDATFVYHDVSGHPDRIELTRDTLGFTFCQVPFVYTIGDAWHTTVQFNDGTEEQFLSGSLPSPLSRKIFARDGGIRRVNVTVDEAALMQ